MSGARMFVRSRTRQSSGRGGGLKSAPLHQARTLASSATILFCLLTSPVWSADPAALWDFAPYRVQVLVAVAQADPGDRQFAGEVASRIELQAAANWGAACDVEARPLAGLAALEYLTRLADPPTAAWLPTQSPPVDKLFVVAIEPLDGLRQVRVRELDATVQTWSPTITRSALPRDFVATAAFAALAEAFQPLALVDDVDGQAVRLRFRARGLNVEGQTFGTPAVGSVLQPFVRIDTRSGQPVISRVEWTVLSVTGVEEHVVAARLFSGYRSPLSGRKRGQMRTLALLMRPNETATTLRLVAQGSLTPLRGYDVFTQAADDERLTALGQTDIHGVVSVPALNAPLVQATIKHGDELLARVPLAPGVQSALTLELPDDRARLEAEGLTVGLQERIVDLFVQRQSLLSEARSDLSAGKLDEAERRVKQLQQLPRPEPMFAELRNQRLRLQTNDSLVRTKIERLLQDTEQVLRTYGDERDVAQLERELLYKRKAK